MPNEELAAIALDFEKWMPGVFNGRPIKTQNAYEPPVVWLVKPAPSHARPDDPFAETGCLYAASDWCDAAIAALIESAVLDWLEKQNASSIDFTIDVNDAHQGERCVEMFAGPRTGLHVGHGPTRLHRLHAACLAAFGKEPTNAQ